MIGSDLSSSIVHQIEDSLKTDRFLLTCARDNNGWIRLEFINRCKNLSDYTYEAILHALSIKSSNQFELSSFEPRCIRSRCQTVVVTGLPSTCQTKDHFVFFNRFFPIEEIIPIPSFSTRCQRIVHVKFKNSMDAIAFVQQSKQQPIRYLTTNCIINCELLNEKKPSLTTTEQIAICQNINIDKSKTACDFQNEQIVLNKFSYDFSLPHHLIKQEKQPCVIISAHNPFCFTVQLRERVLEFDRFQREINEFYNTNNDRRYLVRREEIQNNLCVICSDENKIWNRSQILDYHPSDQTVNLFYVDLGTWEEYVPINRLRHLTEHFHQFFVCSITCRLASIHNDNENDLLSWSDDATKQFLAVIGDNPVDIEFLSMSLSNCFQTKLFVWNSNLYVCVNDYLVHIQQAKRCEQNEENMVKSDEHDGGLIHPVVSLYNRLGEVLQQSRTASTSSSNLSSPSFTPKLNIKLIHIIDNRPSNQQQEISMIFIHYEKMIFIPDFNLIYLLRLSYPGINQQAIERYALNIHYRTRYLTQESNFDLHTQLSNLNNNQSSHPIALYTLDFIEQVFQHYQYSLINVNRAIKNAKQISDISHWFSIDNEFRNHSQQSSISYRLPFSNRLITHT